MPTFAPRPPQPLRRLAAAFLAVFLVAGGAAPTLAQTAIKVLVNNEPITSYDISNRARLLKLTTGGKAGQKQAIDELIDERLKLQEAARRNLSVSDSEVDAAFASMAARAKLAPAQLEQALRQAGVDPATLKQRIGADIAWSEIIRARFRATVSVTEKEVAAALAKKGGEAAETQTLSQYELQQIIFVVPAKAGKGTEAQMLKQANGFRSRFTGCENSLALARTLKGVVVKPNVRREESQLSGDLGKEIAATAVGKTTRPERIPEGYQVIGVCAKTALKGQPMGSDDVRAELSNERGELLARRYLSDLRADAVIEYR